MATRFWDALRWAQTHLQAGLTLPSRPRRAAVKGVVASVKQAVVLEPEMLRRLEQWIEKQKGKFTDKLVAAIGAWACAVSCLRFTHAQRARLVSRSSSAVVLNVYRGKGRVDGARPGFEVRLPREGVEVGSPADRLWELCSVQGWKKDEHGIIRDMTGSLFSLGSFTGLMRTVLVEAEMSSTPEAFTTYSLRRFLPTGADALHIPVDLRHALGAWQGAVDVKTSKFRVSKCMPVRYSGCRGETEEQLKLFILAAVKLARDAVGEKILTWSEVRSHAPAWEEGRLQKSVASLMQSQVEWSPQATDVERRLARQSSFRIPVRSAIMGKAVPLYRGKVGGSGVADAASVSGRLPIDPKGEAASPANKGGCQ